MDTIFATATAPIKSGVAVIRISGQGAGNALSSLTGSPLPKPRFAKLAKLLNPNSGELIDEALILWFKEPASFTGEDVAELHVHGGRAVVAEILSCLASMEGLRIADPGEFSRRAFENGKMDLTEAEGLADLIDAETKMQARLALRQKQGELGRLYEKWREDILVTLANIEAYIDFPDEEIPPQIVDKIEENIKQLSSSLKLHINDNRRGERIREGVNVAIIGPPNAGKSSLMNLLAKRDVAIVSEHAGTTRDVIEIHLDLGGYPITLADTAGIRETSGEIESEGIKRAIAKAENADFKIIVFSATDFISFNKEDIYTKASALLGNILDKHTVIVINKIDLSGGKNIQALSEENLNNPQIIASSFQELTGINEILLSIKTFAEESFNLSSDPLITRERHRTLLNSALASINEFSLQKEIELAAEDLRSAANYIGQITGRINVEEILDRIFSSFCIGK